MPARFRTLLLVLLLTGAVGACGQKGPLVAPPGALENAPPDASDAPEDNVPADTASPEDDSTPIDETNDR